MMIKLLKLIMLLKGVIFLQFNSFCTAYIGFELKI